VAINLNLASKPFNNRVLPWTLTVVILFVAMIGLIMVVRLTTSINAQSVQLQAQINSAKQEEHRLNEAVEKVKESYTAEQLQAIPAAHQLVNRKIFSWSRLLADLETALPGSIRVSRIAVRNVGSDGSQTVAELDLVLFTQSPTTVSEMIKTMRQQGIFDATVTSQTLQKGRGETGTEYELAVTYKPRAGYSNESSPAVAELKGSEAPR
jgi:Tfp pilus assembly protein PilN